MAKFRKRPVVIEAVQWKGELWFSEVPAWLLIAINSGKVREVKPQAVVEIATLEGVMVASNGDWIIQGVNGEVYPCKPDIFEKTYERVE